MYYWFWTGICPSGHEHFIDHHKTWNETLNINNRNARKRHEECSELAIKTVECRQWRRSGVSVNFEHILHFSIASNVDFE